MLNEWACRSQRFSVVRLVIYCATGNSRERGEATSSSRSPNLEGLVGDLGDKRQLKPKTTTLANMSVPAATLKEQRLPQAKALEPVAAKSTVRW